MVNKELIISSLTALIVLFLLLLLSQELLKLKINRILFNFWEILKIYRNENYVISKRRVLLYFVSPIIISIIMKFVLDVSISKEYLSTISTILALMIGFLLNALFKVSEMIEKSQKKNKKDILVELYDSIIYEILVLFFSFFVIIFLFFLKNKWIELLSFIICGHVALVFLFLFRTMVILLTIDTN